MSALVEKKTGFDGNRTLIQGGFCAWCKAGSIFAHDIEQKLQRSNRYKSEFAARHRVPDFVLANPKLKSY